MEQSRRQFLGTVALGSAAAVSSHAAVDPSAPVAIDVGRQLFVDDFLIAETNLRRTFHKPRLYDGNPVLKPETPLEMNGGVRPVAAPFNDGVVYDPKDRLFKMWYHAGWFDAVGYAISEDGLKWKRPSLDIVPGTNRVNPARKGYDRDGCPVWLDHEAADPSQRFKMFTYYRHRRDASVPPPERHWGGSATGAWDWECAEVRASPDGIHWSDPVFTGPLGDNSGFFYNPFRKTWVYTIRMRRPRGRSRAWREHPDLLAGAIWKPDWQAKGPDISFWLSADDLDLPDPELGYRTELYDVDAVAYESVMLGLLALFKGIPEPRAPKVNDLTVAFCREGFRWDRPDRTAFLACSREKGTWNRGYLHTAGGICLVVGDQLYFYFGAWSGISPELGLDTYAGGSTGVAMLCRDGFASMDGPPTAIPSAKPAREVGTLTTRPVTFSGRHLFVNAKMIRSDLRAEILDRNGRVIEPFSLSNCVPFTDNATKHAVEWKHGADLKVLAGQPVRFRFQLTGGQLYSFLVSPDASGASYGYIGAGGPGFTGPTDTTGA
ncbi:MAG: glycosyl hydrolase family 32 [Bryobacteraceae bacterium]